MKFEHLGITINNVNEVTNFYENIFKMKKVRSFELNTNLAEKIFNISQSVEVYLMQNDYIMIELFVHNEIKRPSFDHFCLSFNDRQNIVKKAMENDYEVIIKERKKSDLIFIKDNTGNIFEIKESK
ncbi:MAG: hypothetical protein U9R41_06440 [Candidatus Marinimicrobia bacterium]|nr:hypothetical protein [Candidatus Neomarinimicrobiota bacterium]